MKAFENKGFKKIKRVPSTKTADAGWQKHITSGSVEFYLTAWVYHPTDYNPKTTIDFDFQIDSDERDVNYSTRVSMFSFEEDSLSERRIEEIIHRAQNVYEYLFVLQ